jgi:hypothetical protein
VFGAVTDKLTWVEGGLENIELTLLVMYGNYRLELRRHRKYIKCDICHSPGSENFSIVCLRCDAM